VTLYATSNSVDKILTSYTIELEGAREGAFSTKWIFTDAPFWKIFKGSCPDCPWKRAYQIWSHGFNRFGAISI